MCGNMCFKLSFEENGKHKKQYNFNRNGLQKNYENRRDKNDAVIEQVAKFSALTLLI